MALFVEIKSNWFAKTKLKGLTPCQNPIYLHKPDLFSSFLKEPKYEILEAFDRNKILLTNTDAILNFNGYSEGRYHSAKVYVEEAIERYQKDIFKPTFIDRIIGRKINILYIKTP